MGGVSSGRSVAMTPPHNHTHGHSAKRDVHARGARQRTAHERRSMQTWCQRRWPELVEVPLSSIPSPGGQARTVQTRAHPAVPPTRIVNLPHKTPKSQPQSHLHTCWRKPAKPGNTRRTAKCSAAGVSTRCCFRVGSTGRCFNASNNLASSGAKNMFSGATVLWRVDRRATLLKPVSGSGNAFAAAKNASRKPLTLLRQSMATVTRCYNHTDGQQLLPQRLERCVHITCVAQVSQPRKPQIHRPPGNVTGTVRHTRLVIDR